MDIYDENGKFGDETLLDDIRSIFPQSE